MAEIILALGLATIGYTLSGDNTHSSEKKIREKEITVSDVFNDEQDLAKKKFLQSKNPSKTGVIPSYYNQRSNVDENIDENQIFTNYGSNTYKSEKTTVDESLDYLVDVNNELVVKKNLDGPESYEQFFEEPTINPKDSTQPSNDDLVQQIDINRAMALNGGYSKIDSDMTYGIVDKNNFKHNAMYPYYSGSHKGYGNEYKNNLLERFTGTDDKAFQKKKEQTTRFDPAPQINTISQINTSTDALVDRFITNVSKERRNELLQDPERVAPGLNIGADGELPLGYHSTYRVTYPSIDDTRVLNKQKEVYEGRTLEGLKYEKRGLQAEVVKRRPFMFKENTDDDLQPTLTNIKKPLVHDGYFLKETTKENSHVPYSGPLHSQEFNAPKVLENFRTSSKPNFEMPENIIKQSIGQQKVSIPSITNGLNKMSDNNIESWKVNTTKRETTNYGDHRIGVSGNNFNKGTYIENQDILKQTGRETLKNSTFSNLTNINKASLQPTDTLKSTLRESTYEQKQGQSITSQIPQSYTELMDIAKTTKKETTLDNNFNAIKPSELKSKIFDPNDLLKQTIRETTIDNNNSGQINNYEKSKVFNPNDILKQTIKETTIDTKKSGQIDTSLKKNKYFDPNDLLKNTIRESTINNKESGNIETNVKKNKYFDSNDVLKSTIKESTIHTKESGQIESNVKKLKSFNPFDILKSTIKESTINNTSIGGVNLGTLNTHNTGYLSNKYEAKTTIKEQTTQNNHLGSAQNATTTKLPSYTSHYNGYITDKDSILVNREPTVKSSDIIPGKEFMNIRKTQSLLYESSTNINAPKIIDDPEKRIGEYSVKLNVYNPNEVRLDPELLNSLSTNPYTFLYNYQNNN